MSPLTPDIRELLDPVMGLTRRRARTGATTVRRDRRIGADGRGGRFRDPRCRRRCESLVHATRQLGLIVRTGAFRRGRQRI
jgi:hypothetical protein